MAYCQNNLLSNNSPHKSNSNNIFSVFCATSSIRGMQKINKAQTPFLKVLWVGFVFTTTLLLLVTIVLLVKEYLAYYTGWNTSTKLEDESLFPAITMCSHNPFSLNAKRLWNLNLIKTPSQFTERLINLSLIDLHESTQQIFDHIVLRDEVQNYYTCLTVNETINLSHLQEFFQFCVVDLQDLKLISRNCTVDFSDYLRVRMFSHRNYFNCWTVEPKKINNTRYPDISSLIVVASIIPSQLIPALKNAFVMDILERGEGLKIVLHETGTYPDIDKDGFNIQPGKLNEISYEPIEWTFLSTPIKICKDDQNEIRDLDRVFNYSFSQCVDTVLQADLIEECKCLSSLWPRLITPNEEFPYCFNIWRGTPDEIKEKLTCISRFMSNMKARKQSIQMNQCFPRCKYFSYSTTLSITKWLPSIHKLDRVHKVQDQVELIFKNRGDKIIQDNFRTFLTTKYQDDKKSLDNDSLDEDRFTYIKLIRKNKNTTVKVEKLVLDVAILLSRIGGLCSLFIGLTVAFFIELVEFVYLLVRMNETRTLVVQISSPDPIGPGERIHWQSQNIAKENHRHAKQIKNLSCQIDEIDNDKLFSVSNRQSKIQDSNDNDISIWCQGEANNDQYHKQGAKRQYFQTIVSEL